MKNLLSFLFISGCMSGVCQTILLSADHLFDGTTMHDDWSVLFTGQEILEVGPTAKLLGKADSTVSIEKGTIMPGMIEGHAHVLLYPYNQTSWNDQVLRESPNLRAIRGAKMAEKNLMAGFTTIRDLGSEGAGYADVAIKNSIEMGITNGPRMLVAGPAIVATGSYGPKGFHQGVEVPLGAETADGDDLIRVVRDQIGKGVDFIKVYADYRWGPDGMAMPTFTLDELKLIVEVAKSSGRSVVAHAATVEGMRRATLAGVVSIEHGTEATMDVLQLMKEKKVALCPTLAATYAITTYRGWDDQSDPEPEIILEKRHFFERALKSGVTIVAGGDVGVFEHGQNARELVLMNEYGMSNLEVLRSVTSVNASIFNLPKLGHLKAGYLADIIVVGGKPHENIADLFDIKMVIKDGLRYR